MVLPLEALDDCAQATEPDETAGTPLSYGQRALWFLDRLAPGNSAYVIAGAARVPGGLDVAALARAAAALAARHPGLRTTFHDTPAGPVQRVGKQPRVDFREAVAAGVAAADLAALLTEIAYRPFSLAEGPLWRLAVVHLDECEDALVLAVHHIVADFWSLAVLVRELGLLYAAQAGAGGRAGAKLPPPPATTPALVIEREQRRLAGEEGKRLWQFWRQALAGRPAVLELPADRPRPRAASYRGGVRRLALPAAAADELRRSTRRQGATLFQGLLAVFDVLLQRASGQESLVVGCPTTGRKSADLLGLVGYLVNPVAIGVDLAGDPSFGTVLNRVREAALAAFAHQDYPLPLLAERLQPGRDAGVSPLFQVMCVLQKGRRESEAGLAALSVGEAGVELPFGDRTLISLTVDNPGSQFDLTLACADVERGLVGRLNYSRDLFDAATAARMAGHLETLLTAWAADPAGFLGRRLAELPLLTAPERQQLVVEWNDETSPSLPPDLADLLVPARIAARAAAAPDVIALATGDTRLSYGELMARAARIGGRLAAAGVGPESVVAVLAGRSFATLGVLLGIWRAGGAFLPLDASLPDERLAVILDDAVVAAVVVERALADRLPEGSEAPEAPRSQPPRLVLEDLWAAEGGEGEEKEPPAALDPAHPAYVIYTSGSTGKPKGVVIPHAALSNRLTFTELVDYLPRETYIHKMTLSFDAAIGEIFGPLLVGGTLRLARRGAEQDPGYLADLMRRERVLLTGFTPAMLQTLVSEGAFAGCPNLRTVLVGGEALPAELAEQFAALSAHELRQPRLHNRYGPTETTITVTSWACGAREPGRVVPIGRPIARAELYVVDGGFQPVPVGVPGELVIGGANLGRGYLGRPGQTAAVFVPHPLAIEPGARPIDLASRAGARLYRSGDLVRFRTDGALEFIGRIDGQVKVRGYRVELGEIEICLHQHPAVERAVVVDRAEAATGSRRLIAYVVPRSGESVAVRALRDALAAKLPSYMVPSAFVLLDQLPLSPTGKVDRRALPDPNTAWDVDGDGPVWVAPSGPLEESLAAIWSDLLPARTPGRGDDFFALGGHSLLATRLVSRVRETLGVELPLSAVFEAPTLAGLAAVVGKLSAGAGMSTVSERGEPAPALVPRPRNGPLPLSFAQERLWFLERFEPGLPVYNMPGAFDLQGALDRAAFGAALDEVVRRHEALRTTFHGGTGQPVQVIAPAAAGLESSAVPLVDLAALPTAARAAEAARLARAEGLRPFDLARGPLLRTTLLRLAARRHRVLLTLHHIVADGWSIEILLRELGAFYRRAAAGSTAPLPTLPALAIQPADFALWQREWLTGDRLENQLAYWREALAGLRPCELPADHPRPLVRSGRGDLHRFVLPVEHSDALSRLARATGTTLFMTLLAGLAALVARLTNEEDVAIGSPVANRGRAELEGLIGFFVNTLVLRSDLRGDPPVGVLLDRVRRTALAAYAHQDLPFEKVVGALAPERDPSRTPLFQVMFALQPPQSTLREALELPGLTLAPVEIPWEQAKFDLTLFAAPAADGLAAAWESNRDLFEAATIDRLSGWLASLLAGFAREPATRLTDLPLLTAGEQEQLLGEWNALAPTGAGACLHRLFEEQARRAPEAPAVVLWGEGAGLTYGELDARADRLAGRLRWRGVGPEVVVGICLERSVSLVVAILGVLKAGGAYLPLDPAYPAERLHFLLADAEAALVVTDRAAEAVLERGLAGCPAALLRLDESGGDEEGALHRLPDPGVRPENLAYVLYTSGSTGRPRGVQVTHANVARLLSATDAWFGFGPTDVWTLFHSFAFDFSVWEMWGALAYGGRLVVVPYLVSRSPQTFAELLSAAKVTVLNQTPSAFAQLVPAPEAAAGGPPLALRLVIFGGEALDPRSLAPWAARHGLERPLLVNMYGITETTVHVTYRPLGGQDVARGGSLIGRPIPDLGVRVLDRSFSPQPVGVPGELCVAGPGLARGYHARPELTAARFVPDPWGEPGARLYRSGDLVRRLAGGDHEYLGRIDFQVKVRGFRIELGEIEAALTAHPLVAQAVVVLREDRPGERRLVAYVVGTPGLAEAAGDDLRGHLQARLPEYMVPAVIVPLEALPLTVNGKVDRAALPIPGRGLAGDGFEAPRTAGEQLLAALWAELLHVDRVGARDNFFALGGDSILSLQMVSRAARAGCRITPRQVFECPVLADLAAVAGTVEEIAVEQGPVTGALPLTPIQQWFLAPDPVDPHHFNQSVLLRTAGEGGVRAGVVAQAWSALVRHHDALRSRFAREAEGWRQWVAGPEDGAAGWARVDLAALSTTVGGAQLTVAASAVQASLDLARGPIARAVWLDLPAGESRLLLVVHHLAVDGVSWRILVEDLATTCGQLVAGSTVRLPAKTMAYRDWAELLVAHAETSEGLAAEADGWRRESSAPAATLPIDHPGGRNRWSDARRVDVALSTEETRALLQEVPAAYRTRIDDVLLTALARTLAGPGQALRVHLEGHGRDQILEGVDLARTVGWFTTLDPVLLAAVEGDPGSALRSIKEQLRSVAGRGFVRGLLQGSLPPGATPEVSFNDLGQLDAALPAGSPFAAAAEEAGPARSLHAERGHLLDVGCAVSGGRLRATLVYSADLHRRSTVEAWAEQFLAAVRELIDHCRARVEQQLGGATPSDFPLAVLSQPELDQLLGEEWGIEDVYPLSPLQEGLLFETLLAPGTGVYVVQVLCRLAGAVDAGVLEQACRWTLDRHPILRTSFHGQGLDRPLQVVHAASGEGVLERLDWRGLPPAEEEQRLADLLAADRTRGFDPERAPLMRWTLASAGDGSSWMLWTHHHLLLDGWSLSAVAGELLQAYGALSAGEAPRAVRRRPFREAIARLESRGRLETAVPGETESFWRRTFAGWSGPTPLVDSWEHSSGGSGHRRTDRRLSAALTAALEGQARRHQLTLNTLVQAAWGLLLGRSTGVDDVVFGATVSGRPPELPGVEEMVGLFINTLPVRVRLDRTGGVDGGGEAAEPRLLPWLREQQLAQAELRQHEHSPLVAVQAWSGVPRGRALFETILVFENYPIDEAMRRSTRVAGDGGLAIAEVRGAEQPHYPVSLGVMPGANLRLGLDYDAALFDPTAMTRLVARLEVLLDGMARSLGEGGETVLSALPLLTAEERAQLAAWAHGPAIAPENQGEVCLHELFERQVERQPDAVALIDAATGECVSYGEIDRRANRLAARLAALGVGPEVPVGVALERSVPLVLASLAVLKAGGVYLPLDPAYPRERLTRMIADSRVLLVVSEDRLFARLPADTVRRTLAELESGVALAAWRQAVPANLAYVLYTSGSTGTPKGVGVAHGAVARYMAAINRTFGRTPASRLLFTASPSFDVAIDELYGPLTVGATLCVLAAPLWAPAALSGELERLAVTEGDLPTAYWQEWVRHVTTEGEEPPAALATLFIGGEAAPVEVARHWHRTPLGRVRLFNGYGPTEAVITATGLFVTPESLDGFAGWAVPVGDSLDGRTTWLLDHRGGLAPWGVAGEVCLGGLLARGYLGRPDLTAERFVPDAFGRPGERLYRTGDLARWTRSGALEFLGRLDGQVKIRGFRIEPGEIEAALGRHPAVAQAAVVVRRDGAGGGVGDPRLAAYVVLDETAEPVAGPLLRAHLAETLPAYMVPARVVVLAALPLTPNGKLDRRALAALAAPAGADAEEEGRSAPRTPLSPVAELVATVWSEVLAVDRMGAEDDFFALGGHSLLATRILSRVRQVFGIDLPLRTLFDATTVAAFAREVEAALAADGHGRQAPPLVPVDRDGALPLSFAQERLWFLDQLEPGNPTYNMPAALRLSGALDRAALTAALAAVVHRHEALRTTFADVDGRPFVVIGDGGAGTEPALPLVDLTALSSNPRGTEGRRLAAEEAQHPFDLARGPLLRAVLLRLEPGEHALLFTLHHIVADGWSIGVLVRDVAAAYQAHGAGQAEPLSPLPIQYADYAVWQRQALGDEALAALLGRAVERLAGAPQILDLPTDRPRPPGQTWRGETLSFALPAELESRLAERARAAVATPFMVLLAAFEAFLHRLTGQSVFLVGSMIANRPRRELEDLIGFFINSLVLRADLTQGLTFAGLLHQAREAALFAFANAELPFERLVEEMRPERDLSRSPLVQVVFQLLDLPSAEPTVPGLTLTPIEPQGQNAKFDLLVNLSNDRSGAGGRRGAWHYRRDLFDRATIVRMARQLTTLLTGALTDPDRPVTALPLLGDGERHQLLIEWGSAAPPASTPSTPVHRQLAAQAARRPDAIALACEGAVLTYGELADRARALALVLAHRGIGPGSRVGLCLDRSLDLVLAIVGVLEAGAAYVPLDPGIPKDRLQFLLEDSGIALLLTAGDAAANLPASPSLEVLHLKVEASHQRSRGSVSALAGGAKLEVREPDLAGTSRDFERPPASADTLPLTTPDDLAYIIYTSGSTGHPKGVGVRHAEISRLLSATDPWFHFDHDDVWTLFHSYAFDFSVWELWGALAYGGRLVVVPYWTSRSPDDFRKLLRDEQVTVLNQTPSAFRQLIQADEEALARGEGDLDLRLVVFGGEALEIQSLAPWWERHGDHHPRLVNMYGITETTVHVTYRALGRNDLESPGSTIGRPIPDLAAYVLDLRGEPVSPGVTGELYVGGAGVALGYLGRPALTAERFVPDPWSHQPGARLYRSGDLARHRLDGDLEYLGRADEQVKVRGFRIELGEIETTLARHPAVRDAVVLARDEAGKDRRLVAYLVVQNPAAAPTLDELRRFAATWLTDPMLPTGLAVLPALPLTPNGKVDRRSLARIPLEAPATPGSDATGTAPRTPTEELLAGIFAEVLGRDRIGIDDDFFALGGHSLLATQVAARVRAARRQEMPLRQLFEAPTVRTLAQALEAAAPPPAPPTPARPHVAPRTPIESLLADIWRDLLGRDQIGAYDSFLELGGSSLLGARLTARVYDALEVEMPPGTLAETHVLAEMALAVEELVIAQLDLLSEDDA